MEIIKNWAIAILGILCLLLYYSNVHKTDQLKTVEETATEIITNTKAHVRAMDTLLDETCYYIEERYGEYLPDTIWEGDIYDEYIEAREWVLVDYD